MTPTTAPDTSSQSRRYRHLCEEDRSYFAGYLNQAFYNLNRVITELKTRFEELNKGRELLSVFNIAFRDGSTLHAYEGWLKRVGEYLPFVVRLDERYQTQSLTERVKKVREEIGVLIRCLNYLRNFYTHKFHRAQDIDEQVYEVLDYLLLASAKHIKSKYLKQDKTKEILSKKYEDLLAHLVEEQGEISEKRGKKSSDEELLNGVLNACLHGIIAKNPGQNDQPLEQEVLHKYSRAKLNDKEKDFYKQNSCKEEGCQDAFIDDLPLSQSGFVFLICLFLTKREGELFCAKIKGFYKNLGAPEGTLKNNILKHMVRKRIYSLNAFCGVKHKIHTDEHSPELFGLRIIEELNKVPNLVYQLMGEGAKSAFVTDYNSYYREGLNGQDELVVHPIIRKRYSDEFAYFAVRFLDDYAKFPTLRFQVHVGEYVSHAMTKEVAGQSLYREVKQRMTIFARLSEVIKAKNKYFENFAEHGAKEDEETQEGKQEQWQLFPNPSYNFPLEVRNIQVEKKPNSSSDPSLPYEQVEKVLPAGKVAIWVKLDKEHQQKLEAVRPQRSSRREERLRQLLGKDVLYNTGQATAYLSLQDLHAMVYAIVVEKKTGEEIERKIIEKIQAQIESPLPSKQKKQALGIDYEKLKRDINKEIADCQQRLEKLREQRSQADREETERRSQGRQPRELFGLKERGRVGSWLADDIKRFMNPSVRRAWRSTHHQMLQRTLAAYSVERDTARKVLGSLGRTDALLFPLKLCWKQDSIDGFYEQYLETKKKYLEGLNISDLSKRKEERCFQFLHQKNYRLQPEQNLTQRILQHPIALRCGVLAKSGTMREEKWYQAQKEEQMQKFYLSQEELNKKLEVLKSLTNSARYSIVGKIERQKRQDCTLLLIVKHVLRQMFTEEIVGRITLARIEEGVVLKQVVPLALGGGRIKANKVKLKDVGKYVAYERDKRVQKILAYDEGKTWDVLLSNDGQIAPSETLQGQLEAYDMACHSILCQVHQLECQIRGEDVQEEALQIRGNENFKQYLLNGFLRDIARQNVETSAMTRKEFWELLPDDLREEPELFQQVYVVVAIRNAFAHGDLPSKAFFDYCKEKYSSCISSENYYPVCYEKIFAESFEKLQPYFNNQANP